MKKSYFYTLSELAFIIATCKTVNELVTVYEAIGAYRAKFNYTQQLWLKKYFDLKRADLLNINK